MVEKKIRVLLLEGMDRVAKPPSLVFSWREKRGNKKKEKKGSEG